MKNKKLLYVLIPATILIWGWVVYKFVMQFGGNDTESLAPSLYVMEQLPSEAPDTFSLSGDYRDPFSGIVTKRLIAMGSSQAPKEKVAKVPVNNPWPKIQYGGLIKNQKSNKQRVLILIDGNSHMMSAGERVDNLELTKVFRDSIEVKFGKERKYVGK